MKTVTIHNLAECTAQEVFDFIANHLLTQNAAAKNGFLCMYRSDSGLKCAAGCLIPDADYKSAFEEKTWNGLVKNFGIHDRHKNLIRYLQSVHDLHEPSQWPTSLRKVAEQYSLSPAIIENFKQITL